MGFPIILALPWAMEHCDKLDSGFGQFIQPHHDIKHALQVDSLLTTRILGTKKLFAGSRNHTTARALYEIIAAMENIQQIPHLLLLEVSCSGEPDLKNPGQGKLAWHSGVQKK